MSHVRMICVVVAGAITLAGCQSTGSRSGSERESAAAVARLVARELEPEKSAERRPSEAESLAAISELLDEADGIGAGSSAGASIARDYADAIRAAQRLVHNPPSAQPLVRAGVDALGAGVKEDGQALFLGLLGVGSELSKLNEFAEKFESIHTRVVACRIRAADLLERLAGPETGSDITSATFSERRSEFSTASDTLFLKNVSGVPLTQVAVVVELSGARGETFKNCFFTERWEPGATLRAACDSDRPGRETVTDVKRVRYRVLSAERTGKSCEISP